MQWATSLRGAGAAIVIAAAAGCGGGSTAPDAAGMRHWTARVQAACRKAQDAIVLRGAPRALAAVPHLAAAGAADARAMAREIRSVPVPHGAAGKVGAFERALDRAIRATEAVGREPPDAVRLTPTRSPTTTPSRTPSTSSATVWTTCRCRPGSSTATSCSRSRSETWGSR